MLLIPWEQLPPEMRVAEVRPYYDLLKRKTLSLLLKRCFDVVLSVILIIVLSPVFIILAIAIKLDSHGPVFFRQERVTQFGRKFRIFKFRSMFEHETGKWAQLTVSQDDRVTTVGKVMRRFRLDEISQLLNVLYGTMTFVGTRPEVPKYVDCYTHEMLATLLLPAGITSEASIKYKDEDKLLKAAGNPDKVYVEKILPDKMKYNLNELAQCGVLHDLAVMWRTFWAVFH